MKYLITGGAGFIGSNLVKSLLDDSHEIIVIDNLSSGFMHNIEEIKDKIEFHQVCIEDFDLNNIKNIDVVVHLAAQASVPFSIEKMEESSSSNLISTIKIINFCHERKIPLVYASSSAIYGDLEIGDDASSAIDLQSPYSADKYVMEVYAEIAHKNYDLRSMGLRFFNIYGPKQDPSSPYSGVISIFIDRLLKKKSILINGGHQTRDFVYVDDAINCIKASINKLFNENICDQVNVLTGKSISIEDLADNIAEILDFKSKKIFKELPDGDLLNSYGSTTKMENLLDLDSKSFIDIKKGLEKTIKSVDKKKKKIKKVPTKEEGKEEK